MLLSDLAKTVCQAIDGGISFQRSYTRVKASSVKKGGNSQYLETHHEAFVRWGQFPSTHNESFVGKGLNIPAR